MSPDKKRKNGQYEKGFIVAGTNSGCGKTTVSIALMAWLTRQGYDVASFKVGPDFIDPGHHTRITGNPCRNLDGWMLNKEYNQENYNNHVKGSDIAIIEGVMGLFDGFSGKNQSGSTAQMAKWLDLPVILVVNAQSMARSAAALLQGFENFDPELNFAGVIFNKIGSENHLDYLTQAMAGHVKMPCLGGIIRDEHIEIPERHLGLVTNDEHLLPRSDIEHLSDIIDNRIDTCRLFKGLVRYRGLSQPKNQQQTPGQNKKNKIKIAVARDKAFCFYYQDNLDLLEKQGAELVYFSPVLDRQLPEEVHGIILGGGYPEVFAAQLSENSTMMAAIKDKSMKGMPIYAECGGFMYLCNSITDHENQYYNMTGCFPFDTRMLKKRKALGYRKITFSRDCIHGRKGMVARGHEFHYSEIDGGMDGNDLKRVYSLEPKKGEKSLFEGYLKGNTFGSYIHLHFGSNPELCRHFIQSALTYQKLETHET